MQTTLLNTTRRRVCCDGCGRETMAVNCLCKRCRPQQGESRETAIAWVVAQMEKREAVRK